MDVPRDPGLLTCMFPFHIMCSPVSILVCFLFPFHMLSYFTDLDLRLVYAYQFVLRITPFVSMTHLQGRYSWTHDLSFYLRLVSPLTNCLYLYLGISQFTIYMVGDGDSSLIFNLLCNHPSCVT